MEKDSRNVKTKTGMPNTSSGFVRKRIALFDSPSRVLPAAARKNSITK